MFEKIGKTRKISVGIYKMHIRDPLCEVRRFPLWTITISQKSSALYIFCFLLFVCFCGELVSAPLLNTLAISLFRCSCSSNHNPIIGWVVYMAWRKCKLFVCRFLLWAGVCVCVQQKRKQLIRCCMFSKISRLSLPASKDAEFWKVNGEQYLIGKEVSCTSKMSRQHDYL